MVPQVAHMCSILPFPTSLVLLSDVVRQDLHLCIIIHKVPDPAHPPQAPVPGQGAHQAPAAQAHQNCALVMILTLNPMLDLKCISSFGQSEHSCSTSPDVVLVQRDDEDSAVGGEDAGHSEIRKLYCKTRYHYSASQPHIMRKLTKSQHVSQHTRAIARCNKQVNDYAIGGKPSKAPDKIGLPLSYMEECWMFKPLDTIANPVGLCRFYQTDQHKFNVVTGPKSAAGTHRVKCLLELGKELGQPLTIVVFKGGMVTLLGLLQELQSHLTLSCMQIHTPEEAKMGWKNWVSCCPICTFVIKNDYTFLNHIIICHYWSSFSCSKCLVFMASSRQQMKKNFSKCGSPKEAHKKAHSKGGKSSRPQGSNKSCPKPKKGKKDKVDKDNKCGTEDDKPCGSES